MKRVVILLGLFMLLSMPMVFADPLLDVGVTAGETSVNDLTSFQEIPHLTIGGIVSEIVETILTQTKYLGVVIFEEEEINGIDSFILYAYPTTSWGDVDFNNLARGTSYETSESGIDVRGVVGTWTTYESTSTLQVLGDDARVSVPSSVYLSATSGDVSVDSETLDASDEAVISTITTSMPEFFLGSTCNGGVTCNDALLLSTLDTPTRCFCGIYGSVSIVGILNGALDSEFLLDLNEDNAFLGDWGSEKITDGFEVDAQSGQALELVPADTYNLFAVI